MHDRFRLRILLIGLWGITLVACQARERSLTPNTSVWLPAGVQPRPSAKAPIITEAQTTAFLFPEKDCPVFDIKLLTRLGKGAATGLGWSNSGKVLAIASTSGTYLFNTEQNRQILFLETTPRDIRLVVFSPDDTLLALGGPDGWVSIWDLFTQKQLASFDAASMIIGARDNFGNVNYVGVKILQFSEEGSFLVAVMEAGKKLLWRVPGFTPVSIENKVQADSFEFLSDKVAALIGTGLQIVNLTDGSVLDQEDFRSEPLETWALHSENKLEDLLMASGSYIGQIAIKKLGAPNLVASFRSQFNYPELTFSPDGSHIAAYKHGSSAIELWDVINSELLYTFSATDPSQVQVVDMDPVSQIGFSPDGRYLAAMGASIFIWDSVSGQMIYAKQLVKQNDPEVISRYTSKYTTYYVDNYRYYFSDQPTLVFTLPPRFTFSPDSQQIAYVTPLYAAEAFDFVSNQPRMEALLSPFILFFQLEHQANEAIISLAGPNAVVRNWDIQYQALASTTGHGTPYPRADELIIESTATTVHAGNLEATLDDIGRIEIKHDGQRLYQFIESPGYSIRFSPDGSYLATAHKNGTVNVWRMSDGRRTTSFIEPFDVKHIIFSPGGEYFITWGYIESDFSTNDITYSSTNVYRTDDWQKTAVIHGQEYGMPIGFWPDSKTAVMGGWTGQRSPTLKGPSLIRLSDGRKIYEWPKGSEIFIPPMRSFMEVLDRKKGVVEIWGCTAEK